ncbi:hypothetical protein CEXT_761471 [Caerostris extrusa]|uniref:Uncharacterized protein n=1 Tax=Caerostris extrusa TaxID=172846 RepID=A0AAV4QIF7_CAEEX|nr:hypothetical protein CEXT_761471 [Caerostris extrusa]
MFSVLSSFGKARNHEPTNIKGEPDLRGLQANMSAVFTERVMHVVEESFLDSFYLIIAYVLFTWPYFKNICASWDNTIGSIIAVSALLIAMFPVLSSFGKARDHELTNIKGETLLTLASGKYAGCLLCLRRGLCM